MIKMTVRLPHMAPETAGGVYYGSKTENHDR